MNRRKRPKKKKEFDERERPRKKRRKKKKNRTPQNLYEQEPNQLGSVPAVQTALRQGLADLIVNQIAVEQQNIVTDPLLNAWQDPKATR